MDQWRSQFSENSSLDRYWSIECSSLLRKPCSQRERNLRLSVAKPIATTSEEIRARPTIIFCSMSSGLSQSIAVIQSCLSCLRKTVTPTPLALETVWSCRKVSQIHQPSVHDHAGIKSLRSHKVAQRDRRGRWLMLLGG